MGRASTGIAILLLLSPLAACGADGGGGPGRAGTATVTPGVDTPMGPMGTAVPTPTAAEPPTPNAPTPAPVADAKASGSGNPNWGTQYALLTEADPAARSITYDLVEWFAGAEAVKACAEDGAEPAENDYCVGYYLRNNNPMLRTLTVHPDAPISTAASSEVDLATFLGAVGPGSVIRFDVDAGRIVELGHIFLP